jgi:hypothetical protein
VSERFMGKHSGNGVSQHALNRATARPRIRVGHPVLDHGSIRLKTLLNGFTPPPRSARRQNVVRSAVAEGALGPFEWAV